MNGIMLDEEFCTCCEMPRRVYLTVGHHPECIWTKPPVVGLDMYEDDEHRRQLELLMGQILSPIYRIQELVSAVTAR
jgi:hypothetical protein